ncbi:MAG: cation:proton antiporter [Flavobacteriales bacterium]|jgi:Kef-type K+ transport system membrane component KefB/nucleotide-binding universal stress UspA family protein|nr:cation:proton antiporter [Flavobacteriales bacterium]
MAAGGRGIGYYVVALLLFGGAIFWLMGEGALLRPHLAEELGAALQSGHQGTALEQFQRTLGDNIDHPFAVLLLQIVAIIALARAFAYLFVKLGQPSVIGEIVAGIVMGPSVLGYWLPDTFSFLFPSGSLESLHFLSQIGLVLFMFVIGMELDLRVLQGRLHGALVISHTSIITLFALGTALAYHLYDDFAPPTVAFRSFALFMGIAMSITAFPVLARIIQERGLTRTRLGAMALATAASDDVTAWCLLAAVIAIVKAGSMLSALYAIGAAVLYVAFMIGVLRPFLRRLGEAHGERRTMGRPLVAGLFAVMLASAWATEAIGIHPLFGAFLAGAIMPQNLAFRRVLVGKLEDVSVVLLLPLFFVFTGLRTRIGLLTNEHLWWTCALVVAVAVIGKNVAASVAARITGHDWKESLSIGALMNTRGLMELVVLNIGYDLGVINAELFAILVIMALLSTFMTGPSLSLIERLFRKPAEPGPPVDAAAGWRVLLSFGQPESGRRALRLVRQLAGVDARASVTALHVTPSGDVNPIDSEGFARDGFKPVLKEASRLELDVRTEHHVSGDVAADILRTANSGSFDLLLVGAGKPLLKGTILGDLLGFTTRVIDPSKLIGSLTGKESLLPTDDQIDPKVRQLIEEARCSVGVFMDKGFTQADRIVLPLGAPGDLFLLHYAERLLHGEGRRLTLLDAAGLTQRDPSFRIGVQRLQELAADRIEVLTGVDLDARLLAQHDLLLNSYKGWSRAAEARAPWLGDVPSTLIIRP